MASITIPGNSPFWMVYTANGVDSGDEEFDDCGNYTFEVWTTEDQALTRADEIANDSDAGDYRICVFKVEPVGYAEKISRVEFRPLARGQAKQAAKPAVTAPSRGRRLVLHDD